MWSPEVRVQPQWSMQKAGKLLTSCEFARLLPALFTKKTQKTGHYAKSCNKKLTDYWPFQLSHLKSHIHLCWVAPRQLHVWNGFNFTWSVGPIKDRNDCILTTLSCSSLITLSCFHFWAYLDFSWQMSANSRQESRKRVRENELQQLVRPNSNPSPCSNDLIALSKYLMQLYKFEIPTSKKICCLSKTCFFLMTMKFYIHPAASQIKCI